jgi:hypothetical protein
VQPDTSEGTSCEGGRPCFPPVMPVSFPFHGYRALCMEKSGYRRSPSTQATRKKMHQLNYETSLVFTESLRASLCQIAKSARPTAMPIDTSINR